jgi:hypothetical protein
VTVGIVLVLLLQFLMIAVLTAYLCMLLSRTGLFPSPVLAAATGAPSPTAPVADAAAKTKVVDRLEAVAARLEALEKRPAPAAEPAKPAPAPPPVDLTPLTNVVKFLARSIAHLDTSSGAKLDDQSKTLEGQKQRLELLEKTVFQYVRHEAEPQDVAVVAVNSPHFKFKDYRSAFDAGLFGSANATLFANYRLALLVATGASLKPVVPLGTSAQDLAKARSELNKIEEPPTQSIEEIESFLAELSKQLDSKPPGASGPARRQRCVLVASGRRTPPKLPNGLPEGLKRTVFDVVLVATDPKQSLSAEEIKGWVDFCTAQGGLFQVLRFEPQPAAPSAPAADGAAAAQSAAAAATKAQAERLRAELRRLTLPVLKEK